ncbi:thioredoxin family protein [Pedobacter sp. MC2016-14]|uniref:thioredoxin family protein n=1 Tax=Pedobacter sp. MC2016-14 TaxID=2897327 RepID=UPI001E40D879|nr:thioredoxin family protein [Pedobacter sp. MC2016-14]MCD0488336.1 thioredoxin family protein [Pedobacter sp. MC2016-14]
MKPIIALLLVFYGLSANAQQEIKFNQTSTWSEMKAQAAAEKKLIFVDCYTSWCGPCKWMDKNVFNAAPVANFYNKHFINAKFDMEKGEGIELRKVYGVQSFPTFLFINSKGEVIHRTGSRMPVEEFLAEGSKAADPTKNSAYLTKKYEEGTRDLSFLLDYQIALSKSDRVAADKIAKEVINIISSEQLNTELGWKAIKTLAKNETDKLGAHFILNEQNYKKWGTQTEIDALRDRLASSTLYGYIQANDEANFFKKLSYFKNADRLDRRKQGVMLEATFYLSERRADEYIKITNQALKNELKDDADKLSFLARWASRSKNYTEVSEPPFLQQAYLMAKRAVALKPEDYSVQSTFANVCLDMKKKEEALVSAKKTRLLADAETSKIQKIAQELLDKVEAL